MPPDLQDSYAFILTPAHKGLVRSSCGLFPSMVQTYLSPVSGGVGGFPPPGSLLHLTSVSVQSVPVG